MKRYFIFFSILWMLHWSAQGQQPLSVELPEHSFEQAVALFRARQYGSARVAFQALEKTATDDVAAAGSRFYTALCARELENRDAEQLMVSYVEQFPASMGINEMYYHLGDWYLQQSDYDKALSWLTRVEPRQLDGELATEAWFKLGYCHLMQEDADKARSCFSQLKGREGAYQSAIQYYNAHWDYEKGNYDKALPVFLELEQDAGFQKVVPYYIAQIYFLKKEYPKAIAYAEPLTGQENKTRSADMARVVADSYFALKQYSKAIPYYDRVMDLSETPLREDYYHLGFCHYTQGNFAQASDLLSQVTGERDQVSQNAYYYLGACYLNAHDKKRARVAFEAASQFDFDSAIQEDAWFQYLKLNYELGFSPFNEIINSFVAFIEKFPKSAYIDQAYDYVGKAFVTTKNYKDALATLEKIKQKNNRTYAAMQRLAYYRGIELFIDLKFQETIEMMDYSLRYGDHDRKLQAGALYWKAESLYRMARFEESAQAYTAFIQHKNAPSWPQFATAYYNLAYTRFNQKQFAEAFTWFTKYIQYPSHPDKVMLADAHNRAGDCQFMARAFQPAIEQYRTASATALTAADYSLYQEAFCQGLMRNQEVKIELLQSMVKRYPQSAYCDDAYFEMARAYVALNQLDKAISHFKLVKENYPQGSLAPKAMLQLGLLYFNSGEYEQSIAFYKRVIHEYPGTTDATEALAGLKNVYVDKGEVDQYLAYTQTLGGFARVDNREQDSLLYVSAERLYLKGSFEPAQPAFEKYLSAFPDGRFALSAHYYLGDCLYRRQKDAEALHHFEEVANRPRNLYTEDALLRQAAILYQSAQYPQALQAFARLEKEAELAENRTEAVIGKMRCLRMLDNADQCILAANEVLALPKLAPEIQREATYLKSQSLLAANRKEEALPLLRTLSKNTKSAEGAEAKFQLIEILYQKGDVAASEKEIFDYIEQGTPHSYWLARSFVQLADIYHSRNEDFQARQYLESLQANYQGDDDIQLMIQERLSAWSQPAEPVTPNSK